MFVYLINWVYLCMGRLGCTRVNLDVYMIYMGSGFAKSGYRRQKSFGLDESDMTRPMGSNPDHFKHGKFTSWDKDTSDHYQVSILLTCDISCESKPRLEKPSNNTRPSIWIKNHGHSFNVGGRVRHVWSSLVGIMKSIPNRNHRQMKSAPTWNRQIQSNRLLLANICTWKRPVQGEGINSSFCF